MPALNMSNARTSMAVVSMNLVAAQHPIRDNYLAPPVMNPAVLVVGWSTPTTHDYQQLSFKSEDSAFQ